VGHRHPEIIAQMPTVTKKMGIEQGFSKVEGRVGRKQ
jgi:hypothetical protein